MRLSCDFEDPVGNKKSIEVQLSPDEVERANGVAVFLQAYALRRAYREAPAGFKHIAHGVHSVPVH